MTNYRSPLRRARGMGSAKSGSHHFMIQRLTAIALLPLCLWLLFGVALFATGDVSLESARAYVGNPVGATFCICLVIMLFYHSALGMQIVLEDYVHQHYVRLSIQVLFNFACFVAAVICIIAIIKIVAAV